MGIIKIKDLIFEYIRRDEEGNVEGITKAVDGVNLDIKQGFCDITVRVSLPWRNI